MESALARRQLRRLAAREQGALHPSAISRADLEQQRFIVSPTKPQVEKSQELADDQPVSQQMDNQLRRTTAGTCSGVPPDRSETPGAMAWPYMAPPYFGLGLSADERHAKGASLHGADPHLRSVDEVTGYRLHAVDGEIGHIENFMIDEADWSIHYFVVDTRNWWFGKRVLISPLAVKSIDWFDRHVELNVSREQVSRARREILWRLSIETMRSGSTAITDGRSRTLKRNVGRIGAPDVARQSFAIVFSRDRFSQAPATGMRGLASQETLRCHLASRLRIDCNSCSRSALVFG